MTGIRIAITGTPVGKSTFCEQGDWATITVQELAKQYDCIEEIEGDGAAPIDVDRLREVVDWPQESCILIDGHLSHLLSVDAAVIIRCEPSVLRERLQSRDYSVQKVEENVECELIGLITAECLDLPHLELNSADSVESMIAAVESWITDGSNPKSQASPSIGLAKSMERIEWHSKRQENSYENAETYR